MKTKEIYRGHELSVHSDGSIVISRDGKVVCSQPSWEFAYHWIDEQRKKART